jgi:acetylornithine deacetylase
MGIEAEKVRSAVAARMGDAQKVLCDLVAIPSLCGQETAAMECAERAFAAVADVRRVELSNELRKDDDFSDPVPGIEYAGRWNLRAAMAGKGGGKRLLLNTHLDVVPPSQGQDRPYDPRIADGFVHGRGSCDAKGQVATIYLAMAALKDLGVRLGGDVIAHLVVEEEVGGNGTLAMARQGEKADGCIVLEPTELRVLSSIRGAVWFNITLKGRPSHPSSVAQSRSALDMGIRVVEILKGYHKRLLEASRGQPLFDKYPIPMPLVVGKFHAGNWPATAAGEAQLEGILGLLPNKTARQVLAEMEQAIRAEGGSEIADNFQLRSTYRHDCSVCPTDHALPVALQAAAKAAGRGGAIDALTASCDACFYNNRLKVPTVVFGGGSLGVAHSNEERMPLADLATAGETLVHFILQWCKAV